LSKPLKVAVHLYGFYIPIYGKNWLALNQFLFTQNSKWYVFHTLSELRKLSMKIFISWLTCSGALYVIVGADMEMDCTASPTWKYILQT